jgi:hypothetical protein
MPKPITGKTHVGERREKRPNGDVYVYERITAYNEKISKTYTVSQKLKGKIKAGTEEMTLTRPKKRKGSGCVVAAVRQRFFIGIFCFHYTLLRYEEDGQSNFAHQIERA